MVGIRSFHIDMDVISFIEQSTLAYMFSTQIITENSIFVIDKSIHKEFAY